MKKFTRYYILSLVGIICASFSPIYMGINTLSSVVCCGAIPVENYPKYIIPYTPISIALIFGVAVMPLLMKYCRRFALGTASLASLGVFFAAERIFETKILVKTVELVPLEGWQMALCYVPPEQYKTRVWEAVDILLGGYSPAFKLHFYLISAVLIISVLNCFYGFGKMIRDGKRTGLRLLVFEAIASLCFLGLCIWACFTSFYRTGELTVPAISAVLMSIFFVVLGTTVGIFVGSLTEGKKKFPSEVLPALASALVTLIMYIGEMILLSAHLYRFGTGFFFDGLPYIVLAPVDICVILISGVLTYLICRRTEK